MKLTLTQTPKVKGVLMSKVKELKASTSILTRPIYRDINTCKDSSIEILLSKDLPRKKLEEIVGTKDVDKIERISAFLLKLYAIK